MAENPPAEPDAPNPGEFVRAAHAVKLLGWAVSTDGKAALFKFEIPEEGGMPFALTMPIDLIGPFNSVVSAARNAAAKRDLQTGMAMLRYPKAVQVANSDQLRGHTIVSFDHNTPDETILVLPDADAYGLAEAIRNDIKGRGVNVSSLQVRKPGGLIMPPGFKG